MSQALSIPNYGCFGDINQANVLRRYDDLLAKCHQLKVALKQDYLQIRPFISICKRLVNLLDKWIRLVNSTIKYSVYYSTEYRCYYDALRAILTEITCNGSIILEKCQLGKKKTIDEYIINSLSHSLSQFLRCIDPIGSDECNSITAHIRIRALLDILFSVATVVTLDRPIKDTTTTIQDISRNKNCIHSTKDECQAAKERQDTLIPYSNRCEHKKDDNKKKISFSINSIINSNSTQHQSETSSPRSSSIATTSRMSPASSIISSNQSPASTADHHNPTTSNNYIPLSSATTLLPSIHTFDAIQTRFCNYTGPILASSAAYNYEDIWNRSLQHSPTTTDAQTFTMHTMNYLPTTTTVSTPIGDDSMENIYRCMYCFCLCSSPAELKRHMKTHDESVERLRFSCSHCHKRFSQSSHLQQHIRVHTGVRPFKCRFCPKSFAQSTHLQQHIKMHTGDKPFHCNYCNKHFSQLSHLQKHTRVHTGEKPYKCIYCFKSFSQSSNLQKHLRVHTGIKPYKCMHCSKSFTQSPNLQKHIRIHTGERPFTCSICSKSFSQSSTLQQHVKLHE